MASILEKAEKLLLFFDFQKKQKELDELQNSISFQNPQVIKEISNTLKKKNQLFSLFKILKKLVDESISSLELIETPEYKDLAIEDINLKKKEIEEIIEKIETLNEIELENDSSPAIMEFRPGVGGIEASLFAEELFNSYIKYFNETKTNFEIVELSKNLEGGINFAVIILPNDYSYARFRFENGVQRVQRVPKTESSGRIHTSTISIVVMAKASIEELKIDSKDLIIDVYRSSGPGGQSVNTTDSAVRITHIPTGLIVTSQNTRSQHKNKEMAMEVLVSRLKEIEDSKRNETEQEKRISSINGGDRSAKIRTYNFPQSRVTDHRINSSFYNLPEIMQGNLEELITLANKEIRKKLNEVL